MPVKDYNADPDLNTQISGINIAEGCAPSGINNAIRQLMADVKEEFEGEEGAVSSLDSTLRALIAEEAAAQREAVDGKAPASHASGETAYGVGTGDLYGHVKLSDYADLAHDVGQGIAATPKAVRLAVPAGAVLAFAGNPSSAPEGYLLCNGAAVSRTTYSKLFEAIGTTYGKGDGSSTFNLPNLTDRFIQGSGTAGKTKAAGLPEISAWWCGPYEYDSGVADTDWGSGAVQTKKDTYNYIEIRGESAVGKMNYYFAASRSNGTYGASTTVQPPAVTMRYYIKY